MDAAAVVGRGLLQEARVDRLEVGRLERRRVVRVDGVVAVGHLHLPHHKIGGIEWRVGILNLKFIAHPVILVSVSCKRFKLEVSRFPESELHGPDSKSEFGRSCPGVRVAFSRNRLTYRAVPIPLRGIARSLVKSTFSQESPGVRVAFLRYRLTSISSSGKKNKRAVVVQLLSACVSL